VRLTLVMRKRRKVLEPRALYSARGPWPTCGLEIAGGTVAGVVRFQGELTT
jgi:hypothetical protein